MNRIKELPKSSSHLLSCTQVITSIQSVVKELLENSLDSNATSIEVKLEKFGLEKIEVKDNGSGIHKEDILYVAKPHCTSKIASHLDLNKIETYGFRGEALAAICAVADLRITTKTIDEEYGFTYTFDHNGNVLSTKPCPCNQGTTITVLNLFNNMPVRRQFYRADKNKKEELRKIEDILIAFGCILTRIRFTLYHDRNLIWQKSAVDKTIIGLRLALGNVVDHMENCEFTDEKSQIKIEVFLPKCNSPLSCSQTSSNRSIVAINKRPVRMKVIDKLLKECYNKSLDGGSKSRYPICYISIEVPSTDIDVNYEPNKTAVVLHNMDIITEQLSKLLNTFYNTDSSNDTNSVLTVNSNENNKEKVAGIHNSNLIGQENNIPNFQLKQSQLTVGLQSNNTKEKLVLSKKLSRKNEFQTPSSKKPRTSANFSTPPNDIYKHINTLESFFSSANDNMGNNNLKSNTSGVNEHNIKNSNESERNSEISILNNSSEKNCFQIQDAVIVNVQRENANKTGDFLNLDSVNKTPQKDETAVENNNLSNYVRNNNPTRNGQNFVKNKDHLVTAVFPINKEKNLGVNLLEVNEILSTLDKVPQNIHLDEANKDSDISSPISTTDWSRGLFPAAAIQPVTVLKPKAIEPSEKSDIITNDIECLDRQEICEVIPNQRKMTTFDYFCRKHRLDVASLNPDFSNQQIAQILSEKWNRLPPEEKAIYKNMITKDYPKNIKNKDKLGKVVSQNLDNIKDTPTREKKFVRKKRRKRIEKNITFSLQIFQEHNHLDSSLGMQSNENFTVINYLAPGIWICSKNNKLYLLNCYRLQEAIIYDRLLATYEFESETLESSFILSTSSLGDDAMEIMSKMDVTNEYGNHLIISDKRLIANGFQTRILRDHNEIQIELTGMTKNIAFYGVPDLKEILDCIKKKGIHTKLSDCRPGKAVLYLQGEAVRIARQSPASKRIEDVEDLLRKMNSLPSDMCLHSKPFLHEFYAFDNIHNQ
ncbi:PMS1 protein homolog 1 [Caerostris darwini]|uniref:PMS1 protein homolog 1 n=1 Tax=Caerostris darwini TaxID=1538125 RepID=A0AAV4V3A5_9ARAC|nr:PMS1 protein homolog 1 [Caerostris darwini]